MNRPERLRRLQAAYQQEHSFVIASLRKFGVPEREVEDLAHEVFLVFYRKMGDLENAAAARPWLYTVCRLLAANVHRENMRTVLEAEPVREESVDASLDPHQALYAKQVRQRLLSALEKLNHRKRQTFTEYEIDGRSMDDIARTQKVPVHTAYTRLKTAREDLRRTLSRFAFENFELGQPSASL